MSFPDRIISVDNFDQSKYDSFKIFLVSNYNVRFLKSMSTDVAESIEITSQSIKITAEFFDDQTLRFHTKDTQNNDFEKILQKIRDISPNSNIVEGEKEKITTGTSEQSDAMTHRQLLDFFNHISNCESCSSLFSEIWSHYTKQIT